MSDTMVKVSAAERDNLLNMAFRRLEKKAAEPPASQGQGGSGDSGAPGASDGSEGNGHGAAIGGLVGALLGGGLGYLSHRTKPEDKDEDKLKRILAHVLGGAAFGGIAGAGLGHFRVPDRLSAAVREMSAQAKPRTGAEKGREFGENLWKNPYVRTLIGAEGGFRGTKVVHAISEALDKPGALSVFNLRGTGSIKTAPGSAVKDLNSFLHNFKTRAAEIERASGLDVPKGKLTFGTLAGEHPKLSSEAAIAKLVPQLNEISTLYTRYLANKGDPKILAEIYDAIGSMGKRYGSGFTNRVRADASAPLTAAEAKWLDKFMSTSGKTASRAIRRYQTAAAEVPGRITRGTGGIAPYAYGALGAVLGFLTADRSGTGEVLENTEP